MKRIFLLAFLGLFAGLPCAFGQILKKTGGEFPARATEPFKIESGKSFSASSARPARRLPVSPASGDASREGAVQDFKDALDLIKANHFAGKKINYDELTHSSVTALLHALDPHSNYFDAREYRELLDDQRSEYNGIGASIANYAKGGAVETYVTSTFPDSPAARAGLRFGDRIVAVDGESATGKSSFDVRERIRGQKGTIVRLKIERASSGRIEAVDIRRGVVAQPSIPDAYLLRPGVGYIDFSGGFNYTTIDELNVALKDLREQGMAALILDLRDNPGGIVEQAVKVAEKFIPAGQIVLTQRGRFEIDNRIWKSQNRSPETMPLVVLANGASASASEIVIGALQDYDRAVVVGENTFGKGLVQSIFSLPGGAGLTLTTAKYYTPSGRSIQRDYKRGNLYDYYQRKAELENPAADQPAGKTVTGRTVFGGNGIAPDEAVKTPALDRAQINLLDPLFFFAREAANGRISGLENYKISRPVQYGWRVRPADFPVTDEVFRAFKSFVSESGANVSARKIDLNRKFIAARLRYNFATAAFGGIAANQVLIEEDIQAARAVNALPRAQNLALAASRTIKNRE